MKITWINHASYLIETEGVSLVCDPWIEGRIFNESWALLSSSVFKYDDFRNVTHIWFSHEHPDHFSPPNLLKIPIEIRQNITILYQQTKDKKVINFCQKNGFKNIIELTPGTVYELGGSVKIINSKVRNDIDSWLLFISDEGVVLNLNDCEFDSTNELNFIQSFTDHIDVLLTQFSYASWVGNKNDILLKSNAAKNKLLEVLYRIDFFKPRFIIPFASFVWFCHEANYHMNEQVNRIDQVYNALTNSGSTPIVLYPGDEWNIGDSVDAKVAFSKYERDYNLISNQQLTQFESVGIQELISEAEYNRARCLKLNNKVKLLSYKPMTVYLTDYQKVFSYCYKDGLIEKENGSDVYADIAFCSQNLLYCFKYNWGYDTISVAGTFEKPENGNFQNFLEYRWIGTLNNQGKKMEGVLIRALNRILKIGKSLF